MSKTKEGFCLRNRREILNEVEGLVFLVQGIEGRQRNRAMWVSVSDVDMEWKKMGKGRTSGLPLNIMGHSIRIGVLMRDC